MVDDRQFGVPEQRPYFLQERHAHLLQPIDRLSALVGQHARDGGILRSVPFGMRHEPFVHVVSRDVDALRGSQLRAVPAQDAVAKRGVAAHGARLLQKDDTRARVRRLDGRRMTARSSADHHDIGFLIPSRIAVGAFGPLGRRSATARQQRGGGHAHGTRKRRPHESAARHALAFLRNSLRVFPLHRNLPSLLQAT